MPYLILPLFTLGLLVAVVTAGILHRLFHPPRKTYGSAIARGWPTDPAEFGATGEEVRFTFADGTASPGWIIQGNKPGGPTLVLTHGWSACRYCTLARVPGLLNLAGRVVVYDLRGHGDSTARRSSLGTREVDDLLAVLTQLPPSETTTTPIVLVGYSMGAGISLVAASRARELPPGLTVVGVICDGAYRRGDDPLPGVLRKRGVPTYPFKWLVAWHLAFWVSSGRAFDRALHASRLACPLLLLHGAKDRLCPLPSAQAIAEAAPDSELVCFPEGGHLNLAIVDPARYYQAIARFLDALPSGAPFSSPNASHAPGNTLPSHAGDSPIAQGRTSNVATTGA